MRATSLLLSLAALRLAAGSELVAYWGQQEDNNERSLGDYCTDDEGIDILIVSFLSSFGSGTYPSGFLGDCEVDSSGDFFNCDDLANDISTCQAAGKKVFLSIAGAGSNWNLTSSGDAEGVAFSLWNSYASPDATSNSPRPFGDVFVNGWDIDVEDNHDHQAENFLGDLVNALRGHFDSDENNTYYISGAPQCIIPETNMGQSIMEAQYDYLFIQFYNNNCAAAELVNPDGNNVDGNGEYNFGDWPDYISGGASANAKLYVGIPASTDSADSDFFFIQPSDLPTLVSNSSDVPNFSGIMIYDAGKSDNDAGNGCNYAQQNRAVLDTGSPC